MAEKPSALDLLRARYREISNRPPGTMFQAADRVSGADAALLIEYRETDFFKTQEIVKKYVDSNDERATVYVAAEQLALCCVDIWISDPDGSPVEGFEGRWTPGLGLGEGPVAFARAARELGLADGMDAIESVAAILVNDWDIKGHEARLSSWTPTPPEVADQFMGESAAATAA